MDRAEQCSGEVAGLLRKAQPDQVVAKVEQLQKARQGAREGSRLATAKQALLTGRRPIIPGGRRPGRSAASRCLPRAWTALDAKTLRDAVDRFKDKLQSAVVVLGSVDDGKVRLAAGVTKNNTDRIRAGDLIKPVAEQVGGKGGGRPDFAQAGGSNPEALDHGAEFGARSGSRNSSADRPANEHYLSYGHSPKIR